MATRFPSGWAPATGRPGSSRGRSQPRSTRERGGAMSSDERDYAEAREIERLLVRKDRAELRAHRAGVDGAVRPDERGDVRLLGRGEFLDDLPVRIHQP